MNITNKLKNNSKDIIFFLGLALTIWTIYFLGTNIPTSGANNQITSLTPTWHKILLTVALFTILISILITGNPLFGWLVNQQNRMSLSRLQMFLWTIVILSAFLTAVFVNLHFGHIEVAMAIEIPQELWLAMGISAISLVGTDLILDDKKDKTPKQLESGEKRIGVLIMQEKPSLLDLVRGEEVGNDDKIDLARLQNLFFTFVLVGAYMANLGAMFTKLTTLTPEIQDIATNFPITTFPELGSSAIALLTISHAGYLVAKTIDKQPSVETSEEPAG